MGLLDIWKDWRSGAYSPKGYEWGSQETDVDIGSSFPARTDLDTAGGTNNTTKKRTYKRGEFPPTDPRYIRQNKEVRDRLGRVVEKGSPINASGNVGHPMMNKTFPVPVQDARKTPDKTPFHPSQGDLKYHGGNQGEQQKWWNILADKIGFDYETAKATWEKKGGFEGLMANPAFTMGLAFMSAGAEGKNIGQDALDNVMKAGGISQHYKKILEDRKQEPIQATAADIDEVKTMLDRLKLKEPNIWEKGLGWLKGDNVTAKYDRAAEAIAIAYQQEIASMQRNYKGKKPFVINEDVKEQALRKVLKDKRVKQKDGWAIFGPLTSGTIQMDSTLTDYKFRAEGGPVEAGKPYVVGEKGPEIIIPSKDGNVLSNDDSQIYAMLLASNPQLQKVSRARAEKILRARFPEYFE
jgi:hypothetical protein